LQDSSGQVTINREAPAKAVDGGFYARASDRIHQSRLVRVLLGIAKDCLMRGTLEHESNLFFAEDDGLAVFNCDLKIAFFNNINAGFSRWNIKLKRSFRRDDTGGFPADMHDIEHFRKRIGPEHRCFC
jgi:hypothetical protein